MESYQKHRLDLHFKRLLALFLSSGWIHSFSLQPDSLYSWTTPRTVQLQTLVLATQCLSLNLSLCGMVQDIGWPWMVKQVPYCTRALEHHGQRQCSAPVLVSYGCCNKLPKLSGLNNTRAVLYYSSSGQNSNGEARSHQGCVSFSRLQRIISFHAFSSFCKRLHTFLG